MRRGSRAPRRSAILVLGMHRSGTSAVARILSMLGAELPSNLLPPATDKPKGFWESRDLMEVHEELLAAAGTSWDDWTRVSPALLENATGDRLRGQLLALLEADLGRSRLFVVKDPRMCRLVPLWRSVLQEFGATVRVVIPLRNPIEVADSLATRNDFPTAWRLLIWLRHVLDAERETRDLPRSVIRYGDLLRNSHRVLATVRRRLEIKWPRSLASARPEIEEFLSAAGRHHAADDRSLDVRRDVSGWVRGAYQALGSIARNGDSSQALAELDQIGSDLDAAAA